jgi:hypothetical protein
MNYTQLENLFEEALNHFPYPDLEPTSCTQGELEPDESGEVDYSEEFTFEVGKLIDQSLIAGGWIDCRRDSEQDEIWISGLFTVARDGDWDKGKIFPESTGINAFYDSEKKEWELIIDSF